jgi:hypothetical protein
MARILLGAGGPRSVRLIRQAYSEEGIECPDINEQQVLWRDGMELFRHVLS